MADWEIETLPYYEYSLARTMLTEPGSGKKWCVHTSFCDNHGDYHTSIQRVLPASVFNTAIEETLEWNPWIHREEAYKIGAEILGNQNLPDGLLLGKVQYITSTVDTDDAALQHERVIEQFKTGGILLQDLWKEETNG